MFGLLVRPTAKGFHRQWSAKLIRQKPKPYHLLRFIELLAYNSMAAMKGDVSAKMPPNNVTLIGV